MLFGLQGFEANHGRYETIHASTQGKVKVAAHLSGRELE